MCNLGLNLGLPVAIGCSMLRGKGAPSAAHKAPWSDGGAAIRPRLWARGPHDFCSRATAASSSATRCSNPDVYLRV